MGWTQKEVSLPGWTGPRKREVYLDGLDQERGKSTWMGWTQKEGSLPGWARKRKDYLEGLDQDRGSLRGRAGPRKREVYLDWSNLERGKSTWMG